MSDTNENTRFRSWDDYRARQREAQQRFLTLLEEMRLSPLNPQAAADVREAVERGERRCER